MRNLINPEIQRAITATLMTRLAGTDSKKELARRLPENPDVVVVTADGVKAMMQDTGSFRVHAHKDYSDIVTQSFNVETESFDIAASTERNKNGEILYRRAPKGRREALLRDPKHPDYLVHHAVDLREFEEEFLAESPYSMTENALKFHFYHDPDGRIERKLKTEIGVNLLMQTVSDLNETGRLLRQLRIQAPVEYNEILAKFTMKTAIAKAIDVDGRNDLYALEELQLPAMQSNPSIPSKISLYIHRLDYQIDLSHLNNSSIMAYDREGNAAHIIYTDTALPDHFMGFTLMDPKVIFNHLIRQAFIEGKTSGTLYLDNDPEYGHKPNNV